MTNSLRKHSTKDPYRYRHDSLPVKPYSSPALAKNEVTFTALGDRTPSFHVDDLRTEDSYNDGTQHSLHNAHGSKEGHLSADGHLNYHQSGLRHSHSFTESERVFALDCMRHSDGNLTAENIHSPTQEVWCTCDDDSDDCPLTAVDFEAQQAATFEKNGKTAFEVNFNGPDDPANPLNWPNRKKWAATGVTAIFTFISPLASAMIAPALRQMAREFNVDNKIEVQMMLSIFVLAFGIGPMFLAPLSELYGRSLVLQLGNAFFVAFNTACGFATSKNQMLAFRFLSGIGGSAPLAIGGGVLGDLFRAEERGKAMGLFAIGPLLGPAIGPVVGSWVAEYSTWRWIFWSSSIVGLWTMLAGFKFLNESYAPYLLYKKARMMRKRTGNDAYRAIGDGRLSVPPLKKISSALGRSFKMLATQPIVQVMSIYMAFSYGVLYLGLSTIPELFTRPRPIGYGQSLGVSGLHYIALGLGFFIGAPLVGKNSDKLYQKFKKKSGAGKPEYRMPIIIPFSFLLPIGLLVYGWSAQTLTHWIVPDIGLFLFGMGTIASFQCVISYLVDAYGQFAASAVAAVTILRSFAGFGFPLFAPAMFSALGNGWGNTVLALAATGIGIPVPILIWLFGEKLRRRSTMAPTSEKSSG